LDLDAKSAHGDREPAVVSLCHTVEPEAIGVMGVAWQTGSRAEHNIVCAHPGARPDFFQR
jgi:hypothetical protein